MRPDEIPPKNREGSTFPAKLPVPDVYRTFFMNLSEEIADTIAAIQGFMAA